MKKLILKTSLIGCAALLLTSCGAQKELEALKINYDQCLQTAGLKEATIQKQGVKITSLEDQINLLKKQNGILQQSLQDCAANSSQGSANIERLIGQIKESSDYIKRLQDARSRQDSLSIAISNKLKRSLYDLNDQDLDVKVKKGVVFISLSDKMLYQSGSYKVQPAAEQVLSKVAKVINDYKDYDVLIVGNTDTDRMRPNALIQDNWDLSALRATSIARILQDKFGVDPARITAGGRSQYNPKVSNDTEAGKAINRRTEILVLPKLDQFMELIRAKN